jgi:hypothetical protein
MKPNGKHFAVRAVFFGVCAVSLMSVFGRAETAHGTFKLPVETRWGNLVMAPGEYEFNTNNDGPARVVTVRSKESGCSGMIMPMSATDTVPSDETKLFLSKSEGGTYIRALSLGESGVMLYYAAPGNGKLVRLVKSQRTTTTASASGGQ